METSNTIVAKCACCGREGNYELDEQEYSMYLNYQMNGRQLGFIQDLFPRVPAWIRSGAIDKYSDGFCICPECI